MSKKDTFKYFVRFCQLQQLQLSGLIKIYSLNNVAWSDNASPVAAILVLRNDMKDNTDTRYVDTRGKHFCVQAPGSFFYYQFDSVRHKSCNCLLDDNLAFQMFLKLGSIQCGKGQIK